MHSCDGGIRVLNMNVLKLTLSEEAATGEQEAPSLLGVTVVCRFHLPAFI